MVWISRVLGSIKARFMVRYQHKAGTQQSALNFLPVFSWPIIPTLKNCLGISWLESFDKGKVSALWESNGPPLNERGCAIVQRMDGRLSLVMQSTQTFRGDII